MFAMISGEQHSIKELEKSGMSGRRRLLRPFSFFLLSSGDAPDRADYIIAQCAPGFAVYSSGRKEELPFEYTHPPLHQHDFYELLCVLDGELYQVIEGIRHYYPAGSACILNPNVRHTEELTTRFRAVYLQMTAQFLSDCFAAPAYFDCDSGEEYRSIREFFLEASPDSPDFREYIDFIPRPEDKTAPGDIHRIADRMLRETISPAPGSSSRIRAMTTELFRLLFDERRCSRTPIRLGTDREARLFGEIRLLMEERNGMIGRDELSAALHYSGNYIYQTVRKYTNMNIVDYAISCRLKEAARLLAESDSTVEDIASGLGFRNKTHFYAVFRRTYGTTPASYRKAARTGSL